MTVKAGLDRQELVGTVLCELHKGLAGLSLKEEQEIRTEDKGSQLEILLNPTSYSHIWKLIIISI